MWDLYRHVRKKVVLPRRIELPTPSLPRTCSTTELRQRPIGRQVAAPEKRRGQCHFGPAKARPGKTRIFHRFHHSSIVRPSCVHEGRITNPLVNEGWFPDSTWGSDHDHRSAELVAGTPEPAASSPGYPRVSAPDGCPGSAPRRPLSRPAGGIDLRSAVG